MMKRPLRSLFLLALSMAALAFLFIGGLIWQALEDLPSLDALRDYQPPQSSMVYDRSGQLVGRYFEERRTVVPMKKMSPFVPKAFVAVEDGDFYVHGGIDYMGVLRAILLEIKHLTVGGRREGGSTITQQVARNMLLSSKQTYVRKIQEMVLAKRIEQALNKDQILHLYLNQIYFGNGAYGIEEGALVYFQKSASELKLFEAAALASIPKSPNKINPFADTNRLKARQHYVLDQMVKHGFISEKQASEAKAMPLFGALSGRDARLSATYFLHAVKNELLPQFGEEFIRQGGAKIYTTLDVRMQNIAEDVLKSGLMAIDKRSGYRGPLFRPNPEQDAELKKLLDDFRKAALKSGGKSKVWDLSNITESASKRGLAAAVASAKLFNLTDRLVVGARVTQVNDSAKVASIDLGSTQMDLTLSGLSWAKSEVKKVSSVLKPGDIVLVKLHIGRDKRHLTLEQDPLINGGLVALDVETGGILAMVGGYDFGKSPFNRVTQAKRQVGSAIKPFIYGLALEKDLATPATLISDEPKAFFDPGTEEFWRPKNHTGKYLGDITFRRCLVSSINTCTIALLEKIGLDVFLNFAKGFDLNKKETPYPRNLTIALGSAENYPIDVANAMRIFPNQGKWSKYHMINSVKHKDGKQVEFQMEEAKEILSSETAFIINNILKGVVSPRWRAEYLNQVSGDLAGKTGTTNDARSVWFIGYSSKVLASVYVGYDDNRSIGANEWGSTAAFPIWANFINQALANRDPLTFAEPSNIEWRYIHPDSGEALPPNFEINASEAMMPLLLREAFKVGTAPSPKIEGVSSTKPLEVSDNGAFAP